MSFQVHVLDKSTDPITVALRSLRDQGVSMEILGPCVVLATILRCKEFALYLSETVTPYMAGDDSRVDPGLKAAMGPVGNPATAEQPELHTFMPGINFTMAIPLKGGSEIKGGAVARRSDMERFGQSIVARGIGRMRAVTTEDQDNAKQACSTMPGSVVPLTDLVSANPLPVAPLTTQGRVIFLYGESSKYPVVKFVIVGEKVGDEDAPKVLTKCSAKPGCLGSIGVDSMVVLEMVEVRKTWRKPNGEIPESAVVGGLAGVELSANFATAKRKRGVMRLGDDAAGTSTAQTDLARSNLPDEVSDFLNNPGMPRSHHRLQKQGFLYEWTPGMFVTFISHQWLGHAHPDPSGQQLAVLKEGLRGLIDGSTRVEQNVIGTVYGVSPDWSDQKRQDLANGYLFLDAFALPQELTHDDTGERCNYTSWLQRGWCRAELWYRTLSNRSDTSVIVLLSPAEAERHLVLRLGRVRAVLVKLGEAATDKKLMHLKDQPEQRHWYRYFVAFRNRWIGKPPKKRTLDTFLEDFQFEDLQDAVSGQKMFGLLCAVLSSDTDMVELLVEAKADVNTQVFGLSEMGFYPSATPLLIAALSNQNAEMISTLISLKADVQQTAQIDPLWSAQADFHSAKLPAGVTPLTGAATLSTAESGTVLRCEGLGCFKGRRSADALERAKLLISHKADVNLPARPSFIFAAICRSSQVCAALFGFQSCSTRTRFWASLPGLTPLGVAATAGDEALVKLLLESGAKWDMPNDRGDLPSDLALANGHKHVHSLLLSYDDLGETGAKANLTPFKIVAKRGRHSPRVWAPNEGWRDQTFETSYTGYGIRWDARSPCEAEDPKTSARKRCDDVSQVANMGLLILNDFKRRHNQPISFKHLQAIFESREGKQTNITSCRRSRQVTSPDMRAAPAGPFNAQTQFSCAGLGIAVGVVGFLS
eukprot:s306_g17.t1